MYRCEKCHKAFKHKNSLVDHMRGAHGIGDPFRCDLCGMEFQSRGAQYRHTTLMKCPMGPGGSGVVGGPGSPSAGSNRGNDSSNRVQGSVGPSSPQVISSGKKTMAGAVIKQIIPNNLIFSSHKVKHEDDVKEDNEHETNNEQMGDGSRENLSSTPRQIIPNNLIFSGGKSDDEDQQPSPLESQAAGYLIDINEDNNENDEEFSEQEEIDESNEQNYEINFFPQALTADDGRAYNLPSPPTQQQVIPGNLIFNTGGDEQSSDYEAENGDSSDVNDMNGVNEHDLGQRIVGKSDHVIEGDDDENIFVLHSSNDDGVR